MLLVGFALLARHFEDSEVPAYLPRFLPDDWTGGLVLLVLIFVLSSFLDNIAAALIGGAVAHTVYKGKVHIGYLAAIVAASNAGGAGSVLGDTTTTMMWIDGVAPTGVLHAYVGSFAAFLVFGIPGSLKQQRYAPIQKDPTPNVPDRLGARRRGRCDAPLGGDGERADQHAIHRPSRTDSRFSARPCGQPCS